MRTAALPNFRKLYRKIDHKKNGNEFMNGLPKGKYSLDIEYSKYLNIISVDCRIHCLEGVLVIRIYWGLSNLAIKYYFAF